LSKEISKVAGETPALRKARAICCLDEVRITDDVCCV